MKRNTLLTVFVITAIALLSFGAVFAQDDDITLTLAGWSSSTQEDAALNAMLARFTEETGIRVNFVPSPDFVVTMQSAFAAGDYADVFYIDSSKLPDWVEAGVVDVGEGQIEDPEGFYPALMDIFTYDGVLWCPPKDFSTMALQFNKDLFDAAGLDYPTADWTWEDLAEAAAALTDPGAGVIGLVTPPNLERWLPFLYQAGGELFNEDGELMLDSDAARAALEFYISFGLDGTGGVPAAVDAGWGGEAFGEGRAAMAMEGNWVINFLLEQYPELNWGVTELPAGPAGRATMAFTVCYGVGANTSNPEAAWQLVNFLTGTEGQIAAAEVSFGPMPSRDSAAEAYLATWIPRSEGIAFDPADVEAFVAGAEYSFPWQLPVGFAPFADEFNANLQRAFGGQITVDDIIFEAVMAAEELSN